MKNPLLHLNSIKALAFGCIVTLSLASCSREAVNLSRTNEMGYQQVMNVPAAKQGVETPVAKAEAADCKIAEQSTAPAANMKAEKPARMKKLAALKEMREIKKEVKNEIRDNARNIAPVLASTVAKSKKGTQIDENLKYALIFFVLGLIVSLFTFISVVFAIIGTILIIVGLVFLILWILTL